MRRMSVVKWLFYCLAFAGSFMYSLFVPANKASAREYVPATMKYKVEVHKEHDEAIVFSLDHVAYNVEIVKH